MVHVVHVHVVHVIPAALAVGDEQPRNRFLGELRGCLPAGF